MSADRITLEASKPRHIIRGKSWIQHWPAIYCCTGCAKPNKLVDECFLLLPSGQHTATLCNKQQASMLGLTAGVHTNTNTRRCTSTSALTHGCKLPSLMQAARGNSLLCVLRYSVVVMVVSHHLNRWINLTCSGKRMSCLGFLHTQGRLYRVSSERLHCVASGSTEHAWQTTHNFATLTACRLYSSCCTDCLSRCSLMGRQRL